MRRRSLCAVALSAITSLSIAASVLAFSGIANGSFETGTFSGNPFDTLHPGSTNVTGWTVDSGSVDWIGSYWPASDGSRSFDLSGDGPGALSQALATTVGNTYTVTFDLSGNPACGPTGSKTGTVGATGASTDVFSYDVAAAGNTLTDMRWVEETYAFVATTATTTLTFTSTTNTSCGPALDNVVVTETAAPPPEPEPDPEPSTKADCMDGGWMALVDAAGNHFKNQGDCVSYVATDGRNAAVVTTKAQAHIRPAASARVPAGDEVRSRAQGSVDSAQPAHPVRKHPVAPERPQPTSAVVPSRPDPSR
jgi:choice-of-anchor C domain-containing protein